MILNAILQRMAESFGLTALVAFLVLLYDNSATRALAYAVVIAIVRALVSGLQEYTGFSVASVTKHRW